MKTYFKLIYSMSRAGRNGTKLSEKDFLKALDLYYETPGEVHDRMSKAVKVILDKREEDREEEFTFYPKGYKSGDRIYVKCRERDCDLYESNYVKSFAGPVLFEKWYNDNRDCAEGPLWVRYVSKRFYDNFEAHGRDIAAEMMGY